MSNQHGEFIWYELLTDNSDAALQFYSAILGWHATDSAQPGRDYRILHARDKDSGEEHPIGGLIQLTEDMRQGGARPIWLGYIGVDDVDRTVANIVTAGGGVQMPAMEVPDVGRIAMVTDPQSTPFYVMQGISSKTSLAFAVDKPRIGHCAWNELATPAPEAAKTFYFTEFGWTKDGEMDMGPMGAYEFIRHNGVIGALMPKPEEMPIPMWQQGQAQQNCRDAGQVLAGECGDAFHRWGLRRSRQLIRVMATPFLVEAASTSQPRA